MSWSTEKGLNFRDTSAYVTDGANETYVLRSTGSELGPTYSGVTPYTTIDGDDIYLGYESGGGTDGERDREQTIDRRIAGVHFKSNTAQATFRIDLPQAGTYAIRLAFGDYWYTTRNYWQIVDDATVLETVDKTGTESSANSFLDATGTAYSAANWPTSNTPKEYTFNSTILRIVFAGNNVSANTTRSSALCHVGIRFVGSALPKSLGLLLRGCG